MKTAWESDLARFLTHLSDVQDESLEILTRKRDLLVADDGAGLAEVAKREEALVERLQQCLQWRQDLLARAEEEGLPSDSIRSLAAALPASESAEMTDRVRHASSRARLLQHQSLTNWVLAQRALIHLSQMLEIIATGGQMQPTYGKDESVQAAGALVDREA